MSAANFAKLKCVQTTLANVVTGAMRDDHVKHEVTHITPALVELHLLPVKPLIITFKLARLVYTTSTKPVHRHTLRHFPTTNKSGIFDHLIIGEAFTGSHYTKVEDSGESVPSCSGRSLEHASAVGQRMRNSWNIHIQETVWKPTCTVTPTKVPELLSPPLRLRMANVNTGVVDISSTYLLTW